MSYKVIKYELGLPKYKKGNDNLSSSVYVPHETLG